MGLVGLDAASVASASKRGSSTTWPPWSSAPQDHTTGPLWYSGPGMTRHVRGTNRRGERASGSTRPGSPDTMSLGRPVEPPDVGAFQAGETASGSGGACGGDGSGR
jgi:hypothetical protein